MNEPSAFGRRLKQLRQEHGLTQEMLADRVGCATQTIRKIEAGSRRPSFQIAARLADELGVGPEDRARFIRLAREAPGTKASTSLPDRPEEPALAEAAVGAPEALTALPDRPEEPADRLERTAPAATVSLPTPLTRLIAREQEVMAVQQLLRRDDVRLLTLVGPGGTGKTRLGLEVAAALVDHFADGVVFVNLVPIRDPDLVVPTIADALGVGEAGGRSRIERLKEALRPKQLLLVLDNFEQLISAAPLVAELLWACPGLKMLVTSRELLRVRGEQALGVSPLPVPDARYAATRERVSQYAAVQLFIERAVAVRPDFAVTNANAPAVAELCQRLDGLPLAIELAAARSTLFAPEAILARLGSRMKLLTGGSRDLPARQQTLRNTITWSYDLLTEDEQKLFRRLAVFVGGRTLAATEAVCSAAGELELDVLDGLASLVHKSLLWQQATAGDEPRFLMLETIWEFGRDQLEHSGEAQATRRAHAEYYAQLVQQAERHLWGGEQARALARLEQEHDNLRAALTWHLSQPDGAEPALRMAGLLWRFWEMRGHWTEGQQWLERALARRMEAPPESRWIALHGAGNLAIDQGEYARAKAYYQESLIVTRELDLNRGVANSLLNLSSVALYQGDYKQAIALQQQALAIFRETGNNIGIAISLSNLANMFEQQGNYDRAVACATESLACNAELRDSRGRAFALHPLANVERRRGNYRRARDLLEECLAIYHQLDAKSDVAGVLNDLGALAAEQDEWETAATLYAESFQLATELGDRRSLAAVLNNLGRSALLTEDTERAAELCGRSLALRRELGDRRGIATALENMGQIAHRQAAYGRAAALFKESLALAETVGDRVCIARCLEGLARTARAENQPERGVRLLAAAAVLREALGAPLPPVVRMDVQDCMADLRARLGEMGFAMLLAEGQALAFEQAVAYALEHDPHRAEASAASELSKRQP